jgi:dihydropteroate synthase
VSDLPQPDRTLVIGILNVTPDSFSDGGQWFSPADAVRHGIALMDEGADIVDVGGESTRPGAVRPDLAEELRRVIPVVRELSRAGAVTSIDTMRAEVAAAAAGAGARLINDVSGGRADADMLRTVAALDVPFVCMHWRGHSEDMQSRAVYADVVAEVRAELREQTEAALEAGIRADHLVVDPGFGFAKTGGHNWQLLSRLQELQDLGFPLLVGASRKAFLGALLPDQAGHPRPARERDDASVAVTAMVASQRVWAVRVHAVRPHRDAVAVARRLLES